jgi:phosphatidylglycerophosphate synthase
MMAIMHDSWTHKLARVVVKPLQSTRVTPNHLTTFRLLTGLAACSAFALGTRGGDVWGGCLWILSTFLDRADGELARMSGRISENGHYYDFVCDVIINGLVFICIGIGLRESDFGMAYILMGFCSGITVSIAALLSERLESINTFTGKAYEGAAGFDFDDVLYIFGPVAWFGWLSILLMGAAIGGPAFVILTWLRLRNESKKIAAQAP